MSGSILLSGGVIAGVLDDNNPAGILVGLVGLIVGVIAWLAQNRLARETIDTPPKNH